MLALPCASCNYGSWAERWVSCVRLPICGAIPGLQAPDPSVDSLPLPISLRVPWDLPLF
jgi:hypothetical protein